MTAASPAFSDKPAATNAASWRWALVALIQLALISLPLIDRLQVQMTGEEVTLEVVPIDPRDLLRGDYVIINLAINRLSADIPGGDDVTAGDRVFLELQVTDAGTAEAAKLSADRDDLGTLVVAGTVTSVSGEEIRLDYGIDAFFLAEGTGLEIERMNTDRITLVVAVTDDGRSLPLRLLVDGKPFKSDEAF